jgi:hypothetical protein
MEKLTIALSCRPWDSLNTWIMRMKSTYSLSSGSSPSPVAGTAQKKLLIHIALHRKTVGVALLLLAGFVTYRLSVLLDSVPDLSISYVPSLKNELLDDLWHVFVAHEPRYDLLGSFVLPTLLLYSATQRLNWTLVIFPFAGSPQHAILSDLFAKKGNLPRSWGNGFQDASHRTDYNPMELNDQSYETMGFFPEITKDRNVQSNFPWIRRDQIPQPGKELNDVCKAGANNDSSMEKECYILLSDNPYEITNFININGGMDAFFTSALGEQTSRQFLLKNHGRLQQYEVINQTNHFNTGRTVPLQYFNVAVHIRRGDILDPGRWIDQQVFANVAKHICQANTEKNKNILTNIHVFSSGPNRDGNWSIMENLAESSGDKNDSAPICANVYFHLDELEFDSWTFMIAADALVMSTSTFSYVPGLIRRKNVYYPKGYTHPALSSFILFDTIDGRVEAKV